MNSDSTGGRWPEVVERRREHVLVAVLLAVIFVVTTWAVAFDTSWTPVS